MVNKFCYLGDYGVINVYLLTLTVQIIGYNACGAAHFYQTSTTIYAVQTLLLLLAPTLYAASIYMILARIIVSVKAQHLSLVPVKWLTKVFVCGDILPFVLQGAGGGIMSSGSSSKMELGQWVIIVGLCVQLVFFSAFRIASITFHLRISKALTTESDRTSDRTKSYLPNDWRRLLFACYFVSVLILVRSVYRVVEFAQGNSGYVISHEAFLYILDASMMLLVMLALNLFHLSVALKNTIKHERVASDETSLVAV
ncbi:hypothetical protein BDW72DRAFT_194955 [Aspergillus terricola var. indicus]